MNNLVKVKLHGDITRFIKSEWQLAIRSVKEAIDAINILTNNGINKYIINNNKFKNKYRILINGRDFLSPVKEINENNYEEFYNSELVMEKDNIKTIDIIPFIEGAGKSGGILSVILAVIIIIVGVVLQNPLIIAAGISLLAAGVTNLLTRPPKANFDKTAPDGKNRSYLFAGPVNTIGEGGPVPVGYGKALIGSQVISSAYKVDNYSII